MFRRKNKSIIISYRTLRTLIGILGMLLPVICIVGALIFYEPAKMKIYDSISYYYHTNMGDFFVGLLFTIAMFLTTYKGPQLIDNIITVIIGIAGFGIAIFPCMGEDPTEVIGIFQLSPEISNTIHVVFALSFFILLAINSMFLFTLSKETEITNPMKIKRNIVYRVCGAVIFLSLMILLILYLTIGINEMNKYKLVLIFETIMLWAFGISWLVKGETILKDLPNEGQV